MSTLIVTWHGQVTFHKEVLERPGIRLGESIDLNLLPGRRAELKAGKPQGQESFRELRGFLKGKPNGVQSSIGQINESIAEAGAQAGQSNA